MLYTLLCYDKEDVVWSWSKEEDDAMMNREGKLGPALRLLPTTTATATILRSHDLVIDATACRQSHQSV
jgi:hypothetical protein